MRSLYSTLAAIAVGLFSAPQLASAQAPSPGTPPKTGYASVNGLRMYYQIYGSGRPLVLLHGGITTIEWSFGKLLPELAKTRRVIAPEQQAHGRTADIDRPLTFEQEADDTAALLKHLGIEQADVIGYSDGGNVGLGLAIRHPQLVRRLVIVGTNANNEGLHPEILEFMKVAAGQKPEQAAASMPAELREAYQKVAPRPQDWPVLISKVMQQAVAFKGWKPEELKAIKAPVMVVIGDADIIKPEHGVELLKLFGGGVAGDMMPDLPKARLAVLPGTKHMLVMERTQLILPLVHEFFDAPEPATKTH